MTVVLEIDFRIYIYLLLSRKDCESLKKIHHLYVIYSYLTKILAFLVHFWMAVVLEIDFRIIVRGTLYTKKKKKK